MKSPPLRGFSVALFPITWYTKVREDIKRTGASHKDYYTYLKEENRKLKEENKLLKARTEALQSAKRVEELYADAIAAMKRYSGNGSGDEDEY